MSDYIAINQNDQWVVDAKGRVVGVRRFGQHYPPKNVMHSELNELTGGLSIFGRSVVADSDIAKSNQFLAQANTAAIQRALDAGGEVSIDHPGVVYVNATLKVPSNTALRLGKQTRLKLVDGLTNTQIITNSNWVSGNTNIEISGGIWDGNNANQTRDDASGFNAWFMLFNKVSNITIRGITVKDPLAWGLTLCSCTNFTVDDVFCDYNLSTANMDGVHILGTSNLGTINNIRGKTGDDMVALVTCDYTVFHASLTGTTGPINDVKITNIHSDMNTGSYRHVRLMDSVANQINRVSISGLRGKYNYGCVLLSSNGTDRANMAGVIIDDIQTTPTTAVTPNHATVEIQDNFVDVTITRVKRAISVSEATARPIVACTTASNILGKSLTVDYVDVHDNNVAGPSAYYNFNVSGCVIENLVIKNQRVNRLQAAASTFILAGVGTINRVVVDTVQTTNVGSVIYANNTGGVDKSVKMTNVVTIGAHNPLVFTNNAAAKMARIEMVNCEMISPTAPANGAIKFIGLSGTCVIDLTNCNFEVGANSAVIRSASESIRVRSMSSPVSAASLTPARGDMILDFSANNDPKRYDGAAWVAM